MINLVIVINDVKLYFRWRLPLKTVLRVKYPSL